jgi:hypothetical protein
MVSRAAVDFNLELIDAALASSLKSNRRPSFLKSQLAKYASSSKTSLGNPSISPVWLKSCKPTQSNAC